MFSPSSPNAVNNDGEDGVDVAINDDGAQQQRQRQLRQSNSATSDDDATGAFGGFFSSLVGGARSHQREQPTARQQQQQREQQQESRRGAQQGAEGWNHETTMPTTGDDETTSTFADIFSRGGGESEIASTFGDLFSRGGGESDSSLSMRQRHNNVDDALRRPGAYAISSPGDEGYGQNRTLLTDDESIVAGQQSNDVMPIDDGGGDAIYAAELVVADDDENDDSHDDAGNNYQDDENNTNCIVQDSSNSTNVIYDMESNISASVTVVATNETHADGSARTVPVPTVSGQKVSNKRTISFILFAIFIILVSIFIILFCTMFLRLRNQRATPFNTTDSGNFQHDNEINEMERTYESKVLDISSKKWIQHGSTIYSNNNIGRALQFSKDGTILATSTIRNQNSGLQIYRFSKQNATTSSTLDDGDWEPMGQFIPNDNQTRTWTALSGDGMIMAMGMNYAGRPSTERNGISSLSRVFRYDTNTDTWKQIGQNITHNVTLSTHDNRVSLSEDGTVLAVGPSIETSDTEYRFDRIIIYKFNLTSNSWDAMGGPIYGQYNTGEESVSDAISLSSNGNRVAIGMPDANSRFYPSSTSDYSYIKKHGTVVVYDYNDSTNKWIQLGQLIEGDDHFGEFGHFLSFSGDGNQLAVSAWRGDIGSDLIDIGYVKVFLLSKTQKTWIQLGNTLFGDKPYDGFGHGISLSRDGARLALGATGDKYLIEGGKGQGGYARVLEFVPYPGGNVSNARDDVVDGSWVQVGNEDFAKTDDNAEGEEIGYEFGFGFGYAMALSENGTLVAYSFPRGSGPDGDMGYVKVYRESTTK